MIREQLVKIRRAIKSSYIIISTEYRWLAQRVIEKYGLNLPTRKLDWYVRINGILINSDMYCEQPNILHGCRDAAAAANGGTGSIIIPGLSHCCARDERWNNFIRANRRGIIIYRRAAQIKKMSLYIIYIRAESAGGSKSCATAAKVLNHNLWPHFGAQIMMIFVHCCRAHFT